MKNKLTDSQLRFFNTLSTGQIVEGKVIKFSRFGVFVKHKIISGLLHKNDITYGRINDVEDFLKINQKINVMIIKIDKEEQQIQFGLKQVNEAPWTSTINKYKAGDTVVGTVVAVLDYGAFLSIANGIEGLLHINEIEDFDKSKTAHDYFKIEEVYQVQILKLDVANKKLSFSLKN